LALKPERVGPAVQLLDKTTYRLTRHGQLIVSGILLRPDEYIEYTKRCTPNSLCMTFAFALLPFGIAAVPDRKQIVTCPVAPPASGAGTCPAGPLLPREAAAPGEPNAQLPMTNDQCPVP
jgi:hypothetical protein